MSNGVTQLLACLCLLLLLLQVKAKGARKITYEAFLKALDHVAAKKVCRTELLSSTWYVLPQQLQQQAGCYRLLTAQYAAHAGASTRHQDAVPNKGLTFASTASNARQRPLPGDQQHCT
jgi:hypothetical protein